MTPSTPFAHPPSTIRLGDLTVCRLGFGAMRLPGKEVWGEPDDPERARAVLCRAVALGHDLIDTAWYYGPFVSNRLIVEALHPYPSHLVIATKLGGMRRPDKSWGPFLRPEELRTGCEHDLRSLRLERLDVVHLRFIAAAGVPFLEALDAMIALQREGKIRHIGLSNVGVREIEAALERTPIVTVQNAYSAAGGGAGQMAKLTHAVVEDPEAVLALCAARGIAYMPFFPLAVGQVGQEHAGVAAAAKKHGVTAAQVAIAWLLARSPVMLPIPGTGSVAHLEENRAAQAVALDAADMAAIGKAG
jgi:aryl-alcohol dehydrogenase-like predicted oxidoreductase